MSANQQSESATCWSNAQPGIVLQPLANETGGSRQAAEQEELLQFSRIATKNNLIKLNWWHSPTQPTVDIEASFLAEGPKNDMPMKIDNNNSLSTPAKSNISHNRHSRTNDKNNQQQKQQQQLSNFNADNINIEVDEDFDLQDSHLLVKDPKPCVALLNQGQPDQMKISGYRLSHLRSILCWICIILTGGLLRLVLHWWRHWYLLATCEPCSLHEAQHVLIEEDYQGNHKLYHVKPVSILNVEQLKKLMQSKVPGEDFDDNKLQLAVHFSSAHFKNCRSLRIFRCKQLVYAWDSSINSFNKINGLDVKVPCSYYHQQRGLSQQEQLSRRIVFGENEISVPLRDVKTLLFMEVLNPFYVFQIFSVVLWFAYDYYYYACVIVLMSVFGISISIIQTKKNQDVLQETVRNTGNAWIVNTKGISMELSTKTLVPGDIIEIPASGCTMQCDAVLLSGNCILDESMLTGESVPVTKTPLPQKRDVIFDKKEHARHTLFCGTKVIQTRYIGSKKVLAFVINTGNITAKGGLIRSILYPPPVDYKFEQDSYKFIQCLALIALIGFIYTLVTKILRGTDAVKIAVESLDLITIVVPPALPAAMTVGRFYAQKRLKTSNIFCISPRSINVAGSIDCCCFDKTGTLTEDGLDMWGVVPKSSINQFQIPLKDVKRLPFEHFLFGMVTCHSITVMNGVKMGDPLDLKMFESTGWLLEDANNIPENEKYGLIYPTILRQPIERESVETGEIGDTEKTVQRQNSVDDLLANVGLLKTATNYDHGIVREFPFTSNLQRMSVITRCLNASGFNVYCKGSPEMLQQLCRPQSLPNDYSQQLSSFAKKGFRIIALAYKSLSLRLNYTKIQRLSREDVENNLEFLGFVVLENRLKPDTTQVIKSLNLANIRTIMITGDNILTAMSVARDCGIVSTTQSVITVHAVPDAGGINFELQYTLELGSQNVTNGIGNLENDLSLELDLSKSTNKLVNGNLPNSNSLTSVKTIETWTHNEEEEELDLDVELGGNCSDRIKSPAPLKDNSWRRHYIFAMDGKTWQIIHDLFPQQMEIILTRGAIYARMSPEQKQSLVVELQNLDYYVAMCGDGANDCGALKVAHTGISLSETESSIASPFTSRNPTIAAVPNVIKEGRAALVTSFGIFKYMAAYSLVQFISVMILYSIDSNLTDKQYLYIDLGLISIFVFFFGKTESFDGQLVKQVPLSSLISPTPLASLLLHLAVATVFQVAGWLQLHQQSWFEAFNPGSDESEDHLGCFENYTMFAISSFQFIILAFVFSKGAPYRKPIWSNWPLCLCLILNIMIVIYLVVYPSQWIAHFFQLVVPPDMEFRYTMLGYGFAAFLIHVFLEGFIVESLIFKRCQVRREQRLKSSKRKYMRLEYNIKSFDNWPPITQVYDIANNPADLNVDLKPTYINLSAEQNLDAQPSGFPGFFQVSPEHPAHDHLSS